MTVCPVYVCGSRETFVFSIFCFFLPRFPRAISDCVSETRESALFRLRRKRATARDATRRDATRRDATRREKNEGGGGVSFRDGRKFITTASERRRASSRVFVFVVIFVIFVFVVVIEADRQTDRSTAGRQAGKQGNKKKKQGDER